MTVMLKDLSAPQTEAGLCEGRNAAGVKLSHVGQIPAVSASVEKISDEARLERLLQRYGNDPDILWLVEIAEPRSHRVKRRDRVIRETIAQHFALPALTVSAQRLASALSAYQASNWRNEWELVTLPETADPRHCALHYILRASAGIPLGWRQIYNICNKKSPITMRKVYNADNGDPVKMITYISGSRSEI